MLQRKIVIRKTHLAYAQVCRTDRAAQQHLVDFWHCESHLRRDLLNLAADLGEDCKRALLQGHRLKPEGYAAAWIILSQAPEIPGAHPPTSQDVVPRVPRLPPVYRALCQVPTAV
jgi:hypothetical protein